MVLAPRCAPRAAGLGLALTATLVALTPSEARAGACCVGATGSQATRLGACERAAAGVSLALDSVVGAWSRDGSPTLFAHDGAHTLRVAGFGALRIDDVAQVGVVLPLVIQNVRAGGQAAWGEGLGDVTLTGWFTPMEDRLGPTAPPSLAFGIGVSLPTGTPGEKSVDGLGADATGTGALAWMPELELSRAFARGGVYWRTRATFSMPRRVGARSMVAGVAWSSSLTGSLFVHHRLTLSAVLGAEGQTEGWIDGAPSGRGGVAPLLGFGLAVATTGADRLTLGLSANPPVPELGRSEEVHLRASLGYTVVWR